MNREKSQLIQYTKRYFVVALLASGLSESAAPADGPIPAAGFDSRLMDGAYTALRDTDALIARCHPMERDARDLVRQINDLMPADSPGKKKSAQMLRDLLMNLKHRAHSCRKETRATRRAETAKKAEASDSTGGRLRASAHVEPSTAQPDWDDAWSKHPIRIELDARVSSVSTAAKTWKAPTLAETLCTLLDARLAFEKQACAKGWPAWVGTDPHPSLADDFLPITALLVLARQQTAAAIEQYEKSLVEDVRDAAGLPKGGHKATADQDSSSSEDLPASGSLSRSGSDGQLDTIRSSAAGYQPVRLRSEPASDIRGDRQLQHALKTRLAPRPLAAGSRAKSDGEDPLLDAAISDSPPPAEITGGLAWVDDGDSPRPDARSGELGQEPDAVSVAEDATPVPSGELGYEEEDQDEDFATGDDTLLETRIRHA